MSLDRPVAPDPYELLPAVGSFRLSGQDITDGQPLPMRAVHDSAGGANVSPALSWSGAPEQTRSYVITCFDPDAPTPSGFWHWVAVGIPASITELPAGAGADDESLPGDAFHVRNDNSGRRYDGAAPPPGDRPHRYFFVAHATDVADLRTLGIEDGTSPAAVSFNLAFHTLARAVLVSTHAH
jgi:Raf kinase inhibitor-like YbhB/YbcL family protein